MVVTRYVNDDLAEVELETTAPLKPEPARPRRYHEVGVRGLWRVLATAPRIRRLSPAPASLTIATVRLELALEYGDSMYGKG